MFRFTLAYSPFTDKALNMTANTALTASTPMINVIITSHLLPI